MPSNEHQVLAVQVDNQALVSQLDTHPVSLMHISHDASSAGKIEMAEPQQDQQSYSSAHHCPQTYADCSHKGSEISQAAADHLHGADDHRHMATDHRHMAVDHCHEATDHRHMAVHHYHVGADHHKSDASGQLGGADQQQLGHPLLLDSSRPVQASASDDMAHDSQSDCESSSRSADSDLDYGQSLSSQLESASGDKRRQISSARDDFARQPDSVGSIAQLFMMRQRAKLVFQVSVLILVWSPTLQLWFLSCWQQLSKHTLCQHTTFQTSCSGETRLVLHVPSSSWAEKRCDHYYYHHYYYYHYYYYCCCYYYYYYYYCYHYWLLLLLSLLSRHAPYSTSDVPFLFMAAVITAWLIIINIAKSCAKMSSYCIAQTPCSRQHHTDGCTAAC